MGEKFIIHSTSEQFVKGVENKRERFEVDIEEVRNNPELKNLKNSEAIIETLIEIIRDGENIGYGKSAEIRRLERHPSLCMKIIRDKSQTLHNADKEHDLQSAARKAGVRVPVPICSVSSRDGVDFLVMETINGFSVEDFLSKDMPLPEGFDIDKFMESARIEVTKMHEQDIYHRDLHKGNIMINENLDPVIIDFGHAAINYFSDEDPYTDTTIKGSRKLSNDDQKLTDLKRTLYQIKEKHDRKGGEN